MDCECLKVHDSVRAGEGKAVVTFESFQRGYSGQEKERVFQMDRIIQIRLFSF